MADIFDLVDAQVQGDFIAELQLAEQPLIGAELWPSRKTMSLDLKFIAGMKGIPISLKPSTLGSRAFQRDRIGAVTVQKEIPFFREQAQVDEVLRRKLVRAEADATDPYTREVLAEIFNDTKRLVDGANVVPERMRMGLLFDGRFYIAGPDKDGKQPIYDYDYDPENEWRTNNVTNLVDTAAWSDHENSDPIGDLQAAIDRAEDYGVTLTRAICNGTVLKDIMANKNFKNAFRNPDQSLRAFSRAEAINMISTMLNITLAIYTKKYKDDNEIERSFVPDRAIALFPAGKLGDTVYATTPEELDLVSGFGNASVSVVNTGVTITTAKEYGPPVNMKTVVSEFVLPSFENMASVFVIKY
jgi:phage major capsid protein E|nr:MAG TPA: Major capsid protein [Caudoviricetes sp.]